MTTTANLTAVVLARARERGDAPCIVHVEHGVVHTVSWADLAAQVSTLMLRLDALASPRGATIGVLSRNRHEWIVVDLAASGRGLVTVSLDPGWSDNMLVRVLVHAAVASVVVETAEQVARLRRLSPRVPLLRSLVVIDPGDDHEDDTATRLATLLDGWRDPQTRPADAVASLLAAVTADDPATVIFTSGSTGEPKGVLRTHGNTLSRGWALFPWMGDADAPDPEPGDVLLDPLSFCHSAGRWWYQTALARGVVLALPDPRGLTLADLARLAPTHIAAVPRVVLALREQLAPHVHALAARVESLPADDPELSGRLGSQIREQLGGRVRCIVAGGAPLATSLIDFFATAGIAVLAGYGGTEPGIVAVGSHAPRGSVGRPTGAEVRIVDGEVVVRGPAVSPGYLASPAATARALDVHGWWHTGDRGALDEAGHLRITGRLHALFNCHDGTNIDPSEIEMLLEADRHIRAAVIVGHRRPFIVALIVADEAMFRDVTPDERARVLAGRIERLNQRLEPFEQIQRLRVVDGARLAGLRRVTATQKLHIDRDAVDREFADEIAAMYA